MEYLSLHEYKYVVQSRITTCLLVKLKLLKPVSTHDTHDPVRYWPLLMLSL